LMVQICVGFRPDEIAATQCFSVFFKRSSSRRCFSCQ
jgi:hypothetical protein